MAGSLERSFTMKSISRWRTSESDAVSDSHRIFADGVAAQGAVNSTGTKNQPK